MSKTIRSVIIAATLCVAIFVGVPAALADGNDDVPDPIEQAICGRDTLAARVKQLGLGECEGDGHFEPNEEIKRRLGAPERGQQYVDDLQDDEKDAVDDTCDLAGYLTGEPQPPCESPGIPEDHNDVLCAVEDQNDPTDGTCDAGVWRAPTPDELGLPASADEVLCGTPDDPKNPPAGSCTDDDERQWVPPNPEDLGAPEDEHEVLCGTADEPRDPAVGSCDEDRNWSSPTTDGILCSTEDPNDPKDGTCEEGTWRAPTPDELGLPGSADEVLCDTEDPDDPKDGTCEEGTWRAPTPSELGAPEGLDETLCSTEDPSDPKDGTCDEGTWRAPTPDELGLPGSSDEVLCGVEDPSDPTDGSCDEEGQYAPPGQNDILCGIEDPNDARDGSCDDEGWHAPTPDDIGGPESLDEVLCGTEEEPREPPAGSCDGNGMWSPPVVPVPDTDTLLGDTVQGLPLNCKGQRDAVRYAMDLVGDADCDDYSLSEELLGGSDPTDPDSTPEDSGRDPEDFSACWSGTPSASWIRVGDLDCDNRGDAEEILGGQNPLDPDG